VIAREYESTRVGFPEYHDLVAVWISDRLQDGIEIEAISVRSGRTSGVTGESVVDEWVGASGIGSGRDRGRTRATSLDPGHSSINLVGVGSENSIIHSSVFATDRYAVALSLTIKSSAESIFADVEFTFNPSQSGIDPFDDCTWLLELSLGLAFLGDLLVAVYQRDFQDIDVLQMVFVMQQNISGGEVGWERDLLGNDAGGSLARLDEWHIQGLSIIIIILKCLIVGVVAACLLAMNLIDFVQWTLLLLLFTGRIANAVVLRRFRTCVDKDSCSGDGRGRP
jgi:hypothetical protein